MRHGRIGTAAGRLSIAALLGATAVVAGPVAAQATTGRVVPVATVSGLAGAFAKAQAGDRIELAAGTYSLGTALRISANGTADAPIVVAAKAGATVDITGSRTFDIDGSYLTFEGLTFRNASTLTVPSDEHHIRLTRNRFKLAPSVKNWVSVAGDDVQVDHNQFFGKSTVGVFLQIIGPGDREMAKRTRIHHNHFADHTFTGSNGGEALRLGLSTRQHGSAQALVEDNLFERVNGDPEAISVKSSDNVIRRNTIRSSKGTITLRHGNRNVVDSNLMMGGESGIRVFGNDHVVVNNIVQDSAREILLEMGGGELRDDTAYESKHEAADRVLVAFNTLRSGSRTALSVGDSSDSAHPADITMANNILVGRQSARVVKGSRLIWAGNIVAGTTSGVPSPGYRAADPRLVKDATNLYRPAADSPVIGAALGLYPAAARDFDGQLRPATKRSVGADEPGTTVANRRPTTASMVGPGAF